MGFFLQLRLLLWKNITLKKRSPFVLLFEVCIPLVLFVILLFIRKGQPSKATAAGVFEAKPLPSSGVIPIMQSFCDNWENDKYGFKVFKESSASVLLEKLQTVAESHKFFHADYTPNQMDMLPAMYERVIDDPAFFHDQFLEAHDFLLSSMIQNPIVLASYLHTNLSLSTEDINTLLTSNIHVPEIYRLLFGEDLDHSAKFLNRVRRDVPDEMFQSDPSLHPVKEMAETSASFQFIPWFLESFLISNNSDFSRGIIYRLLFDEGMWKNKDIANLVMQYLRKGPRLKQPYFLSPKQMSELIKMVLMSPAVIRWVTCESDEMTKLLIPLSPQKISVLKDIKQRLCNMSDFQLDGLSSLLKQQISDQFIIKKLNLQHLDISSTVGNIEEFVHELQKFYEFQTTLYQMSKLADYLPQDACTGFFSNSTDLPLTDVTKDTDSTSNDTKRDNTLPKPSDKKNDPTEAGGKVPHKFTGLLKIWNVMQKTICGKTSPALPKDRVEIDLEKLDWTDLGISSGQKESLQIVVHVLYNNPKVLYAPSNATNNTPADIIIRKANESFAFIELMNDYAKKWLNISNVLRKYLERNSTAHNLHSIRMMQKSMKDGDGLFSILNGDSQIAQFLNLSIPETSFFLHEITLIDQAACSWLTLMSGINLDVFKGFATEEDMVRYFMERAYFDNVTTIAGVVFENMTAGDELPAHIRYHIRQNASFVPTTKLVRNRYWFPGPGSGNNQYYNFGFLWIQDMIERAIINVQTGRNVTEPGSYVHQFPYSCYRFDRFDFLVNHIIPLCLTISWVYSVAMLVQSIVYEKEQRLKEVMKMMGLSNGVHWCAWFITTFIQMTVTMISLTLMLKFGNILTYTNPWIIFLLLETFAIATISFSFLISSFCSKAKVAAASAGIVYFLTYVPYMYIAIREDVAGDHISASIKTVTSLFSTTAFGLGGKYLGFFENEGVGIQWSNIGQSPLENDQYSLLMILMMMLLDSFLYTIFAWYIENIHPGSYGLPKPWYFPFTKSYWCEGTMTVHHEVDCTGLLDCCRCKHDQISVTEEDQACAMENGDPDYSMGIEPEPAHLVRGVCIDNLTKIYKKRNIVAVKKLNLNLYEGQITSFLGHNGAGKTTTMSVLTGLFPPTSGYATIYGHDIRTDMEVIRQGLGMCPQHNLLFDKLTVEEHLWFYGFLKGMKSLDIKKEMETMLSDIGLLHKRHSLVNGLSGGMQRKLSVAIAFVGGSQTVILDEPTAGVDPYARRAIWDMLVKYKQGRTILLSTHHMDEADILGDRIAIIANGQMKCVGSSLFLKNTFGEGYHLYLAKAEVSEDNHRLDFDHDAGAHDHRDSFISPCQESKVTELITKQISTAYLKSESSRELHYILPYEKARKGNFVKLFQQLESALDILHIGSFGVVDTTLEEVFLKVTESARNEEENKEDEKPLEELSNSISASSSLQDASNSDQSDNSSLSMVSNDNEVELGTLESNLFSTRANEGYATLPNDDTSSASSGISLDRGQPTPHFGQYSRLTNQEEDILIGSLMGTSESRLSKKYLKLNQFRAVIVKRFHYITRNWKQLFSQILLPALFVSVAMTVALAAPNTDDMPPIELSPLQYLGLTQPKGNFIPYANELESRSSQNYRHDASPKKLINTFHLPSGIAATCLLKSPFNSTFDLDRIKYFNISRQTFELLSKYYAKGCERAFAPGLELRNYVPLAVTVASISELNTTDFFTLGPDQHRYYPICRCSKEKTEFVCSSDGKISPPQYRVVTQEKMQDITGSDSSKFYQNTMDEYRLHRYGAFSFGLERPFVPENFGENAPDEFKKLAVRNVAKVWYNNKGYHSDPIYLNALNNAILRANLPPSKGNPAAYGITAVNHPMNGTNNHLNKESILQGSDVLIAIFIIAAMSFVPASFVVFLVHERSIKSKHLQFVSGIDPVVYWLANYVWDLCNYLIPAFCIIMILLIFDIPSYTSPTNFPAVISLFLLYGWSITPIMYPASFCFKEPSAAYIFLIVINLFTGITCVICSFMLQIFSVGQDLEKIHTTLKAVFLMFPNYCLGRGLIDIAYNQYKNEFYSKTGQYDKMQDPFEWNLITRNLVAMSAMGLIFFIITLLCEFRFFIRPRLRKVRNHSSILDLEEDLDVSAERKRVLRGGANHDLIRLENITKVYKTRKLGRHLAVDQLCLGVPAGECFGLLGVNGAGKTTTFKMLTGDLNPTAGNAILKDYSILKDMWNVKENIGYCPQFDALFDELTGREHIQLYSRLRGVPPKQEKMVVEWALKKLGITQYADKLAGTYSGGNKRKLSTALALIGHPPIIFMDEPTTGMDPHSRRFLWDLILQLIKEGRSVILTSHSMEECEALCSRLAIMVNGRFQCLGSIQHLKNKYGDGYSFSIRLKGPHFDKSSLLVNRFMENVFPEAKLKEQHYNLVQYELKSIPSLSYVFGKLEEAQKELPIEDFSVSQNTLETVFLNFAKKQVEIVQEFADPEDDHSLEDSNFLVTAGNSEHELDLDDDDVLPTFDPIVTQLTMLQAEGVKF